MEKDNLFIINCAIYPFDILVHIGDNKKPLLKELSKYIKKKELKEISAYNFTRGNAIMLDGGQLVLTINKEESLPQFIATLSHEIFHCVTFIMARIKLKHNKNTEEAFAYLIEYITKEILNRVLIN